MVTLEVSHDAIHWHELGATAVDRNHEVRGWPTSGLEQRGAWPARYVRANITQWPREQSGGRVSATVASA